MSFIGILETIGKDFAKGLGQPGRLHAIEDRLATAERATQRLKGMGAAFGTLLTVLHLAISFVAKH